MIILIYLECHLRAMVSSLGKLLRTPLISLMTIIVIGVALALPANFYVLLRNAQNLIKNWNDNSAQISLYLKMNTSQNSIQELIRQLKSNPQISDVRYISAQQGLQDFSKVLGGYKATAMLGKNPLPELIVVDPIPVLRNPQGVNPILEMAKALPEVEMAQLDLQWLQRLDNGIILVKKIILALAFLLIIGALSIVGNTIRLVAQNERKEMEVMHLVGATNAFIRRPFLYTGIWYGLFGGIIAWFLESLILIWLRGPVRDLANSYHSDFYLHGLDLNSGLHLLFLSALLGLIGSWIVADRYCRVIQSASNDL